MKTLLLQTELQWMLRENLNHLLVMNLAPTMKRAQETRECTIGKDVGRKKRKKRRERKKRKKEC